MTEPEEPTEQPEEPTVTLADMLATGATYRQIDHWTRCGYLPPTGRVKDTGGSGNPRLWTLAHRDLVWYIVRLTRAGIEVPKASRWAARFVETGDTRVHEHGVDLQWSAPAPPPLIGDTP